MDKHGERLKRRIERVRRRLVAEGAERGVARVLAPRLAGKDLDLQFGMIYRATGIHPDRLSKIIAECI